jgi:uncharacterized protein YyaL (SSP411 family)
MADGEDCRVETMSDAAPHAPGGVRSRPWRVATGLLRVGRPSHLGVLLRDWARRPQRGGDRRRHLDETMAWLVRAQDAAGGRGVAAGYSLVEGWLPPYPETTGYIIQTFFDYAAATSREEFRIRAIRMADWEIELQLPSAAVQAGIFRGMEGRRPAVFNTGQVILGWCRAYGETRDERYLDAATRAGNWLLEVQSPDGAWRQDAPETETVIHAYDVRTAWSLLELDRIVRDSRYRDGARRNLEWTASQQRANGWFDHNAFFVSSDKWNLPLTHTIAYVMEGFLEAWRLVRDERYLQVVLRTAEQLRRIFIARGTLPGEFDAEWNSAATYSCLTGDAQTAGVWLRLSEITGNDQFLGSADKLITHVTATQDTLTTHSGIRGGVKGSQPVFGRYTPFTYINWGAKFLADALMLEQRLAGSTAPAVAQSGAERQHQ